MVKECEAWWEANCLYLESEARQAFSDAYWAAGHHRSYLASPVRDELAISTITRNWAYIERAGDIIARAVSLPGLTDVEKEELKQVAAANEEPDGGLMAGKAGPHG